MNLNAVEYWSPGTQFVDLMKSSSPWLGATGNPAKFDVDADDWIRALPAGQFAVTSMLKNVTHYPPGRYLVRYKGKGSLRFSGATIVSRSPGRMVLDIAPGDAGIELRIDATDPADYLRDIQIIMPGGICAGEPYVHVQSAQACARGRYLSFADNAGDILFYPPFLAQLRNFSVLRFMNWMLGASSESPVTNWSQRTRPAYRTYAAASGVPPEVVIALANRLGVHPWITIPHRADDAYATSLAKLIEQQLKPELRVYVEYSNEVWNRQFAQSAYAAGQGAAQSPSIDGIQYYALRAREIGQLVRAVLGASRVVAVYSAQAAASARAAQGLSFLKSRYGAAIGFDAIAIAPYLGVIATPATADTYAAMTLDELFRQVRDKYLPRVAGEIGEFRRLADAYGVPLIAYEGGQHMVGVAGAERNAALTGLFHAFNRDPRIKQLYLDYLGLWKKAGGQLFVHYSDISRFNNFGSWGALEYPTQPRTEAPKFDALQTFLADNPVWWTE